LGILIPVSIYLRSGAYGFLTWFKFDAPPSSPLKAFIVKETFFGLGCSGTAVVGGSDFDGSYISSYFSLMGSGSFTYSSYCLIGGFSKPFKTERA
jgi:hypothetical protein